MNPTIKEMLEEEYTRTLEEVSKAKTGSDEAKWALQKLTVLHKQMIEATQTEDKSRIDAQTLSLKEREAADKSFIETQKLSLEEREARFKEQQANEGKVWTVIKLVIDGTAIVLPIAASWIWMGRGLQFEKTGTFTTRTGNWLSNHLRLFKK